MNKLLVQYCDSKFIQNLCILQLDGIEIQPAVFDKQLYKLYFSYQPTHIIFIANKISEECAQFIEDYKDKVSIYAYHPNEKTLSLIPNYPDSCLHLVSESLRPMVPADADTNKIIYIPNNLINTSIYYSDKRSRSESIIYFAPKGITSFCNELISVLYPNTKLPIKIFDSPKITHPQNLGTLTEPEKGELLRNNQYYLTYSLDEYLTEAIECGCKIVNYDNVMNYNTEASIKEQSNTIKYQDFLQGVFNV
jgi:hypothetical protein